MKKDLKRHVFRMGEGRNPSRKWGLYLFLLCSQLVIFISTPARAMMPEIETTINVDMVVSPVKDSSREAVGQLVVTSETDTTIELTRINTVQMEISDEYGKDTGTLVPTIRKNASALILLDNPQEAEELYSEEKLSLNFNLKLPAYDGLYREVADIYWRYANSKDEFNSTAIFSYLIENGQFKPLTREDFDEIAQPVEYHQAIMDGKEVTLIGRELFVDPTPYKGEQLNRELADTNAKPMFQPIDSDFSNDTDGALLDDKIDLKGGGAIALTLNLEYCVKIQFYDEYAVPPTLTTGMGWWRPLGGLQLRVHQGIYVELWDRDTSNADDFIAGKFAYYTSDTDSYCIDFTWNQASPPGEPESYPDPYVKVYSLVEDVEFSTSNKKWAAACFDDCVDGCTAYYYFSGKSDYIPEFGSNGTSAQKSYTLGSVGSETNGMAMQMNSVQKFLRTWQGLYMTDNINVYWTTYSSPATNPDNTNCIDLGFLDTNSNQIYKQWQMGTHEAGHSYNFQLLGANPYTHGGSHYPFCHNNNSNLPTFEGWANFVAARSWYPNNKNTSSPILPSLTIYYEIEPGRKSSWSIPSGDPPRNPEHALCNFPCDWDSGDIATSCHCFAYNELAVARAFWDLWDDRVDGEPPGNNWDTATTTQSWQNIAYIWTLYPVGTDDGENQEDYSNMRDYQTNSASLSTDAYNDITTIFAREHSCLVDQPTG